eukprot:evm.model.scf_211.1 EVM.evm.TU.scf_211.1   scf_211:8803-10384(+)
MSARPSTEAVQASMEATYLVLQSQLEMMQKQLEQWQATRIDGGRASSGAGDAVGDAQHGAQGADGSCEDISAMDCSGSGPSVGGDGGMQQPEHPTTPAGESTMVPSQGSERPMAAELPRQTVQAPDQQPCAQN